MKNSSRGGMDMGGGGQEELQEISTQVDQSLQP